MTKPLRRVPRRRQRFYALKSVVALLCIPLVISAGAPGQSSAARLADLSIEQLMNESVTSVSKKEQKLGDAAAAVTVLSNDDLQRSGVTTVADALRLVPGMQVATIDSGNWDFRARLQFTIREQTAGDD